MLPSLRPPPTTLTLPSATTTVTDETTTILLTHLGRLQRSYPSGAGTVRDGLVEFAQETSDAPAEFVGTSAAVVTLDDLDSFAAWDAAPCDPDAANAVVSQVGTRIDDIRRLHPNVTNVVLVGADDQIPFARVKDAVPAHNESEYASTFDGTSPLKAALSLGYVLTDNPYGVASPMAIGPRELFVPEIGIGRLVESPAEIDEALQTFTRLPRPARPGDGAEHGLQLPDRRRRGGRHRAERRAVRRRRRSADQQHVDARRAAGRLARAAMQRPPPTWCRSTPTSTTTAPFPPTRTPAGKLTDPFELRDVTDADRGSLDGSIVFSMGCHMGLSVSDISVAGSLSPTTGRRRSAAPGPSSPATPATATATTRSSAPPRS